MCLSVVCMYVSMYVCALFCRYMQVSAFQLSLQGITLLLAPSPLFSAVVSAGIAIFICLGRQASGANSMFMVCFEVDLAPVNMRLVFEHVMRDSSGHVVMLDSSNHAVMHDRPATSARTRLGVLAPCFLSLPHACVLVLLALIRLHEPSHAHAHR